MPLWQLIRTTPKDARSFQVLLLGSEKNNVAWDVEVET
jgi:hypothetical protein